MEMHVTKQKNVSLLFHSVQRLRDRSLLSKIGGNIGVARKVMVETI